MFMIIKYAGLILAAITAFTGYINAQVQLPIDASNCAILNALAPDNTTSCAHPQNLGTHRGLIVTLNGSETSTGDVSPLRIVAPQILALVKSKPIVKNHAAAKSESGYFIHFAFNSKTLEKEYRDHLDRLSIVLKSPAMVNSCIRITGHTDTVGSNSYNVVLSQHRANAVQIYLSKQGQITPERMTSIAAGETTPLPDKPGDSPFNRRVEFSSKPSLGNCILQR